MADSSSPTDFLDFAGEFSRHCKDSLERLVTQTLWEAHPASFYHSAAQELATLLESAAARALGSDRRPGRDVRVVQLTWDVNGAPMLGQGVSRDKGELEPELEAGKPFWQWRLGAWCVTAKLALPRDLSLGDESRQLIKAIVHCWLVELVRNGVEPVPSDDELLFSLDLDEVVRRAAKKAKKAFCKVRKTNGHRSEDAQAEAVAGTEGEKSDSPSISIMLYHPGKPDESSDKAGFLFYPACDSEGFRLPEFHGDLIPHFFQDGGTERTEPHFKNPKTSGLRLRRTPEEMLLWQALFYHELREIEVLYRLLGAGCTSNTSKCTEPHSASCTLEATTSRLKSSLVKNDEFPAAAMHALTHPENFLARHLLSRPLNRARPLPEGDRPICLQPKGEGVAGRVAETYVSVLVPDVAAEMPLGFKERKHPSYVLMGVFEPAFGLRPGNSAIVTPLFGKGQFLGALVAYDTAFEQHDVELLESIAGSVGRMIQEAKDYMFFRELVRVWRRAAGDETKKFESFVKAFVAILPFIMNASDVEMFHSEAIGLPTNGQGPHAVVSVGAPEEGEQLFADSPNEGKDLRKVGFWRWGTAASKERRVCLEKRVLLYIPSNVKDEDGKEVPCTPHYFIQMTIEENDSVFLAHRGDLEVFFNYCIAITGAVQPEEVVSSGVQPKQYEPPLKP
jgi:hypothetical protein